MTDIVDSATRSRMMSGIRAKNTKPEILIRSFLHRRGLRFRIHVRDFPGKPDIVLPRFHAVIFIHGCFWHGHDCPLFKLPSTRTEFWREKISRNQLNDQKAVDSLHKINWRIGIIWECAIRGGGKNVEDVTQRLIDWLKSDAAFFEERR